MRIRNSQKQIFKRVLAAFFLLFLMAEWGSHAIICSNHASGDGQMMSSSESGHDDPCATLILCSEGQQKDRQMPSLSHDCAQPNGLLGRFEISSIMDVRKEPGIPTQNAEARFRPPDLPFHPPELS